MKRVVLGLARDPARMIAASVRISIRWPPTIYVYLSTFGGPIAYINLGIVGIQVVIGSWITSP